MDFVDDVHLMLPAHRKVFDLLAQISDIIHSGAGRPVDLNDVHRAPLGNLLTDGASVTGLPLYGLRTVDRFREDPRNGRFSHTSNTRKQVGVGDLALHDGRSERLRDMALAHHLREGLWPPPTSQNLVTHFLLSENDALHGETRFPCGTQEFPYTVASFRTWRG